MTIHGAMWGAEGAIMKEIAIVYDDEDFVETLLRDVAMMLMTECHADVEDKHINS